MPAMAGWYYQDGMEISRAAKAVLAQLNYCDGHLTHAEVLGTVNFYDPAIQGFGERVRWKLSFTFGITD
jgi:hypothetical protein